MAKIEIRKQTTQYTGAIYYFVDVDGRMQSGTFTSSLEEVEQHFEETKRLVALYPETVTETIREEEV